MAKPRLTVAILAGGAASRLGGRDKGLESLLGKPMIEWVVAACPRDAERVVVANRSLDDYARYGRVVTDAETGFLGPLAGVASALAAATTSHVLTLPVDCPDPPPDLAKRLAAFDVAAAVAHDGERRQPLFALYLTELAESAAAGAKAGQGVWEWQESIGAVEVDFADERRQFHNLNTPEEFAAYADALRTRD
jgi:molybdopterin-guanine dinucleotide biosynthesis protein A